MVKIPLPTPAPFPTHHPQQKDKEQFEYELSIGDQLHSNISPIYLFIFNRVYHGLLVYVQNIVYCVYVQGDDSALKKNGIKK